jgi:NAD(P)-dependent dehydrogenase (short-subunit alcohol dehydrogenase family)
MKSVVVTGASSGIGHATAELLVKRGFQVFGSVRKPGDAESLKSALGSRFVPLLFDVTDAAAVAKAAEEVKSRLNGETLTGLINNAGIAVAGPLLHIRVEDFRHQLDVNLTGQLIVVQAFTPLLDGPEPGRIVMISSIGGTNATPFIGPYHTTKFGLEGFSESLRRELMVFGIDVVVIAPGAIDTPIWDKADKMDVSPYADTVFARPLEKTREQMLRLKKNGLPAERIAKTILTALTAPKPKTRYEIVPDPVTHNALRLLPKRWADQLYAKVLGLTRKP